MTSKKETISEAAGSELQKKNMSRGMPPTRGIYVFVTQEGQISHQFRGEPPLNEAEVLGLGQYLTQIFSLASLENTQIGLSVLLKKVDQLISQLETESDKDNAYLEKEGRDIPMEEKIPS